MKYIPQIDGLRFCAILAVFLYHSPVKLHGGWIGVDLFFVISGFLITRILESHRDMPLGRYFAVFYQRRALRILPPYVLLLVVTTILFGREWLHSWYLYFGAMNLSRTGYPSLSMLWSLAVEEQFYLIWPFIVLLAPRKRLPWVALLLIVIAPILRALYTPLLANPWLIYKLTPFRMDELAAGALIGLLYDDNKERISKIGLAWLIPAACGIAALEICRRIGGFSTADFTVKANVLTYEFNLLVVASVFLWALSDRGTQILKFPVVRWVGRVSYSFYLIHITAFVICGKFINERYLLTLVTAIAALAYAAVSWYVMEQPLTKRRKRQSKAILVGPVPTTDLA
jgi:peptidoglycan/LPS O-acetylase OafA/YrhL